MSIAYQHPCAAAHHLYTEMRKHNFSLDWENSFPFKFFFCSKNDDKRQRIHMLVLRIGNTQCIHCFGSESFFGVVFFLQWNSIEINSLIKYSKCHEICTKMERYLLCMHFEVADSNHLSVKFLIVMRIFAKTWTNFFEYVVRVDVLLKIESVLNVHFRHYKINIPCNFWWLKFQIAFHRVELVTASISHK